MNFNLSGRPSSSALRHWDVVEYSEVADSIHARIWSNEKTADMDGPRYSPDDPYYRLGPVHTCLYVRVRETGGGWRYIFVTKRHIAGSMWRFQVSKKFF